MLKILRSNSQSPFWVGKRSPLTTTQTRKSYTNLCAKVLLLFQQKSSPAQWWVKISQSTSKASQKRTGQWTTNSKWLNVFRSVTSISNGRHDLRWLHKDLAMWEPSLIYAKPVTRAESYSWWDNTEATNSSYSLKLTEHIWKRGCITLWKRIKFKWSSIW